MAESTGNNGHNVAIEQIDVLWITAGLGCDGDTIAMTAATQPSIEDVVSGGIPWIPKVNFHNPFLAAANGDEFLKPFHQAAKGKLGHSFWWWKVPSPTRPTRAKGTGRRWGLIRKPDNRSLPANGLTSWLPERGRS